MCHVCARFVTYNHYQHLQPLRYVKIQQGSVDSVGRVLSNFIPPLETYK